MYLLFILFLPLKQSCILCMAKLFIYQIVLALFYMVLNNFKGFWVLLWEFHKMYLDNPPPTCSIPTFSTLTSLVTQLYIFLFVRLTVWFALPNFSLEYGQLLEHGSRIKLWKKNSECLWESPRKQDPSLVTSVSSKHGILGMCFHAPPRYIERE